MMFPEKIAYLEFYVFNAFQAAHFYRQVWGFDILGYAGPETGIDDKVSYILKQGSIKLIISSSIDPESPILKHAIKHDDGIGDVAFLTSDVHKLFEHAIKNGATSIMQPIEINDGKTRIVKATISAFDDVVHSLIQIEPGNDLLPYYINFGNSECQSINLFDSIDHLAIAINVNNMEKWRDFYERVFNFHLFYSENIDLGDSGMKSTVMSNNQDKIKFVFVEPISRKEKSQIENYISYNKGLGVQHMAFLSQDIIKAIRHIQDKGLEFIDVPKGYYQLLDKDLKYYLGVNKMKVLQDLKILIDGAIDKDRTKTLLQVFTKYIQNRPTFFIEIIQRDGIDGFGSNNIKALYTALQKKQNKIANKVY